MRKLLGGAEAALAVKIASGFAVAALAATTAGTATEVAVTGTTGASRSPSRFRTARTLCGHRAHAASASA